MYSYVYAQARSLTLSNRKLHARHTDANHMLILFSILLLATVVSISNAKRVAFQREGWGVAAAITRSHVSGSCLSERPAEEKSEGNE